MEGVVSGWFIVIKRGLKVNQSRDLQLYKLQKEIKYNLQTEKHTNSRILLELRNCPHLKIEDIKGTSWVK